jgi:peptidoglycan/LPS O-acetylase OafA/YrhL
MSLRIENESKKNSIIELIRFLAACKILCSHVGAPWAKHVFVLPIFLIFSIVFTVNSRLSISAQRKKAFERIMLPWFFWSAVYQLARIARSIIFRSPMSGEFHWWILVTGTSATLWFLPYAFFSNMAVLYAVKRYHLKPAHGNSRALALCGGLLLFASSLILPGIQDQYPYYHWTYLAPAILIGMLFTSFYFDYAKLIFANGLWIVILCSIGAIAFNWKIGFSYLTAIGICSFVFSFKFSRSIRAFDYLGKLSYGIYLVQTLTSSVWMQLGFPKGSGNLLLLTLVSSIFVTALLHKTVFRRFV